MHRVLRFVAVIAMIVALCATLLVLLSVAQGPATQTNAQSSVAQDSSPSPASVSTSQTNTSPSATNANTDALTEAVTRMARVGRCFGGTFSPDGKTLAFICDISGVPQVWTDSVNVYPTEQASQSPGTANDHPTQKASRTAGAVSGWPNLVTTLNDPVTSVEWAPTSDILAIQVAPGGGMNTQIYTVRPDGTELKRYTKGGKDNNWLSRWTRDGRALAMSSNLRTSDNMDSYLLEVPGGEMKLVAENPGIGTVEDVSHDGRYALVSRLKSRGSNDVFLVDLTNNKETLLTPHEGPGEFSGLFGRDSRTVYLATNKDRDMVAFGKVAIGANGEASPIKVIAQRSNAELDSFEINDQGTTAALLWNDAGHDELAFVDLATEKEAPGPQLPAELAGGMKFSHNGKLLALTISGSAAPSDVWVMDMATKQLRQITHAAHAGVNLAELVRPKLVRFSSFDGLPLSGWLYLPKNYNAPGPVVLSFHGGPEGEEVPSFHSDYQALLSQRIAVFAPNVRGSSGFGKKFVNLDNGPLRVNGVKDIKACTDYLVQNKIGDPRRLGIMGGSYGGYMVMAGLTEFPDLFAAGADLFGVVNFETFFEHTEPWMAAISTVEYGDPKTQADMLRALSPIHKVDRVKAATIVLHGANDTNVPVVEAEQVVNNLKQRGVPVKYVLFPDEGHGWRKVPNRIRSTVEITKWFSEYLNGSPVQSAAAK